MRILFLLLLVSSSVFAQQTDTMRIVKKQETEKRIEYKDPIVTLSGKRGGDITVLEAKNSCCLLMSDNNSNFRVTSFILTIKGQGDVMSYQTIGNTLTKEMIAALGKLRPGTIFSTEEIMARGNDGVPRKVAPLYFKIKAEGN